MTPNYRADHNFGELKATRFTAGDTPYLLWREETRTEVPASMEEVDVLEHLRFNIEQLKDLNNRFQFLMEELSSVLIKRRAK